MKERRTDGRIPVTYDGQTAYACPTPKGIERARAILQCEQGMSPLDFPNEVTPRVLEDITMKAERDMFNPELSAEAHQEAWTAYSRGMSCLRNLQK